jgi:hypothetical protein
VLTAAGANALWLNLPISAAIALLLVIVIVSYRQTIFAYPSAAALRIDHVLTIAVSITSGVAALISAVPVLDGSVGLVYLEPGSLGASTRQTWQVREFAAPNGEQAAANFLNEPLRQGPGEASCFLRNNGSAVDPTPFAVCQGGNSCGSSRQAQPLRNDIEDRVQDLADRMEASRPTLLGGGKRGSRRSNSPSERSVRYGRREGRHWLS